MRTTITLDQDVAAAVEAMRRDDGVGISEVVNRLVRRGLAVSPPARERFRQETFALGVKLDITNVAEVLELLDDE